MLLPRKSATHTLSAPSTAMPHGPLIALARIGDAGAIRPALVISVTAKLSKPHNQRLPTLSTARPWPGGAPRPVTFWTTFPFGSSFVTADWFETQALPP